MKKHMVIVIILGLVVFGIGGPVLAFTDDFNRDNSSDLGLNWTIQNGSIGIIDNQAASSVTDHYYATVNGFSGSYLSTKVSVDAIDINGGLAYVAVMLGFQSGSESIFVKVQDQGGDGYFNYGAIYYGNTGGGNFFLLDSPFQTGRITTWAVDADTIGLGIDTNFDNDFEQSYSYAAGWSSKTLGTGIGLGMYGNARADNFSTEGGMQQVPEPTTMLLLSLGMMGVAGIRRKLKK